MAKAKETKKNPVVVAHASVATLMGHAVSVVYAYVADWHKCCCCCCR